MDYIAHIRSADGKIQTVAGHLLEVKSLAEGLIWIWFQSEEYYIHGENYDCK